VKEVVGLLDKRQLDGDAAGVCRQLGSHPQRHVGVQVESCGDPAECLL